MVYASLLGLALLVQSFGFADGFSALADALGPDIVGQPIEAPHTDFYVWIAPDDTWSTGRGVLAGNVIQRTTRGEMEWIAPINRPYFVLECLSNAQQACPRHWIWTDDGATEVSNPYQGFNRGPSGD